MKYKLGLLIVLVLVLLPLISSEAAFYVEKGEDYCIKFSCEINGARCTGVNACNITINYPNSSLLIDDTNTTNLNNGYFQYCLNENQTTPNGEYFARAECREGGLNSTSTFYYEVNPTGIRPSEQKTEAVTRSIWFLFFIGVIMFLAFLFVNNSSPVRWTFFFLGVLFFLMALNILFVGLQDEVVNPQLESFFDGFTVISFYIYWFIGGLLAIMWIFTFINTWLLNKNMKNFRRFGYG